MYTKTATVTGLLALLASTVSAQTSTLCSPMKQDCPPAKALGGSITIDYTKGEAGDSTGFFKHLAGTDITYGDKGAIFKIEKLGQAPTLVSNSYIFFGRIEVELQVSPGTGIVSSIVLQSDDLDEIDWEWLGGDTARVQTNYFSKGDDSTFDRGQYHPLNSPQTQFYTYTVDWNRERIEWSINNNPVRTLTYADAKGGATYPQQPCQVRIGSWVGGNPALPQGTIDWAGGLTNFAEAPFIGYYKSIKVTDYMNFNQSAKQYVYGDRSGRWEGVIVEGGSGSASSTRASSSSSASTSATTGKTTSSPTSSASTTLSTHSSSRSSNGTATTGGSGGSGGSSTTGGSGAQSTSSSKPTNTGAPGSGAGANLPSALLMGAALVLGYLAL